MSLTKIQVRRDTAANWSVANPTLDEGEFGFEVNTGLFKIGDGATAWLSLPYAGSGGVSSVNGLLGAVVLTTTEIAEGTNKYYLDSRVVTVLTAPGPIGSVTPNTGDFSTVTVGTGTPKAVLKDTGVVRFANLTSTQRNALIPEAGDTIFNTTTVALETYDGTNWI